MVVFVYSLTKTPQLRKANGYPHFRENTGDHVFSLFSRLPTLCVLLRSSDLEDKSLKPQQSKNTRIKRQQKKLPAETWKDEKHISERKINIT